jgi:hypothetical protein
MKIRGTDVIIKNKDLITNEYKDKVYILDPQNGTIHTLNETATFIWKSLKNNNSVVEIANSITKKFQVGKKQAFEDTRNFLENYLLKSLVFQKKSSKKLI